MVFPCMKNRLVSQEHPQDEPESELAFDTVLALVNPSMFFYSSVGVFSLETTLLRKWMALDSCCFWLLFLSGL